MSPLILARPFLLCSAGLSLVLYFLSFSLSPSAQANREKVKRQIKKEEVNQNSFGQVVYRSPKLPGKKEGTIWYIGQLDLNAQTLQNAEILFRTEPEGRDLAKIFAASGEYRSGVWHFKNARRIEYGPNIGLETVGPILPELQLPELTEPPTMLAAKLVPPDVLPWPEVARLAGDVARLNERLRAPYATENWHRWMYPWACPLLCLFGIAFGMSDARRNIAATVFSSVFVLFGFLVFTRLCVALGQGNRIPPFLAGTLPFLLFGLAGFYLFAEKVGWIWELQGWSREHPRAAVWLRRIGLVS